VLSGQHYVRQGGSETVLYRLSETDAASGVQVGDRRFVGLPVGGDPQLRLAIFALAYDQPAEAPITIWGEDSAGNRTQTRFWYRTFPQNFRRRDIQVTDSFIATVAPEILSHAGLQAAPTPLDTFLTINRELRVRDNARIEELTRTASPELLWDQPFLQLSNSKVEAVFADRRSYFYQGRKVDEQTHLGFDLASLAQAAAEASNRGRVVFADYLGIYGKTVILDHGLGLYSLYAHLSSLAVEPGQLVERGQAVGRTGQTGLAGGDHLHFSMVVQGVQVNPVEWWDPDWVRLRVLSRLGSLHPLQ
jgi:murein DD-endopeptidase MepM/ murein hydrolase activator NlpD